MDRRAPPFAFFWLHWATWPVGVVHVALANSLVGAGVSVQQVSGIVAAASLAFWLEILWAPLVDSTFTRRRWFIAGALLMCVCLAALLTAPWHSSSVPLLTALTFAACSGAGIALVATKGIMAYDVPAAQLGRASGYYTAGGTVARAAAGAGTLWLLTHLSSRPLIAAVTVGAAALGMSAIALASPAAPARRSALWPELSATLADLWSFIRTRGGVLLAVLCVIPFGTGSHLLNATAAEWSVSADRLAALSLLAAVVGIGGAVLAGRLSARLGPWRTYMVLGWVMIAVLGALAMAPRAPLIFVLLDLLNAGAEAGCYAAALGLVMSSIGKGAASTKAAALWSLFNLSAGYPTLIDGRMHDHAGTTAMLLTHAGMDAAGFGILLLLASLLRVPLRSPAAQPVSAAV